jgi:hypothetical protein
MARAHTSWNRWIAAAAAFLAFVVSGPAALAAGGDLDPGFGVSGKVMTDFNNSTDIANAVAVQADGKYVVVGLTYTNNDYSGEDFAVARRTGRSWWRAAPSRCSPFSATSRSCATTRMDRSMHRSAAAAS